MLQAIGAALKLLLALVGIVERKEERDTGAALQRGKDEHEELERITRAVDAGNDPGAHSLDVMRRDPNNRDRDN